MKEPSTTTRVVLVRHGQVAQEWHGRLYGARDVPLSDRGEDEARLAAALLVDESFDAVISSSLSRARFGAECIAAGRRLEVRADPDLRELERGAWTELRPDQLPDGEGDAWRMNPSTRRSPEGESLGDLAARVLPRLDALAAEFAGGAIVVVAHSWVIRIAVCEALALSLDEASRIEVRTAGITVVEWPVRSATDADSPRAVVLAGLGTDRIPDRSGAWYRGPRSADR